LASVNDEICATDQRIRAIKWVAFRRRLGDALAASQPELMADRDEKNTENVAGKFYVDSQCIDCDLCRETAPGNFQRSDDQGYSYVFKQPENDEELGQCKEAMEGCPVEAIGDDGED
jgi:ferredoxin